MARILIVDDAAFLRRMLSDMLTSLGHTIVGEADNGETAVRLYKALTPDLVTMDITMPEMDGVTALKAIRSHHKEAKVVMCSAIGQKNVVIEAIQAGAKDFIVKPFSKERIEGTVARALSNAI